MLLIYNIYAQTHTYIHRHIYNKYELVSTLLSIMAWYTYIKKRSTKVVLELLLNSLTVTLNIFFSQILRGKVVLHCAAIEVNWLKNKNKLKIVDDLSYYLCKTGHILSPLNSVIILSNISCLISVVLYQLSNISCLNQL